MNPQFRIRQQSVQLSTRRPVRVQALNAERPVKPHDHDYHEICLLTEGSCLHATKHGRKLMKTGEAIVIRPGDVHAFEKVKGLKVINVYFLAEWLDGDLNLLWDEPGMVPLFCSGAVVDLGDVGVKEFNLGDERFARVLSELDELKSELERATPGQAYLKSCFLKFLTLLSRAWCETDASWKQGLFSADVMRLIRAAEQAIDLGEVFSVSEQAAALGFSPDVLSSRFSKAVGYPPTEYFQRRRTQRACQLLGDLRLSVTEIAMKLGYSDAPHFSRLFKSQRGMTPREYRKVYCMTGKG